MWREVAVAIDVESLLSEVSPEDPCGEDLSYDPSFLALEDALRAKPAGGVVAGVEETMDEPNWRDVRDRSLSLLQRSKDLRVAMYLTIALLKTDGLGGLTDGLSLIHGLLERFWDHLHPHLDAEDNYDPLERMNVLQSLSPATVSEQDPIRFKQRLSEVPLCSSARMGRFSLRDIQLARGEIPAVGDDAARVPDPGVIDAAFQDTATDDLLATSHAAEEAIEHTAAVATVFARQTSQGQAPDLSGFQVVLGNIHKCIQEYLAKRNYRTVAQQDSAGDANAGTASSSGEIRSANDALLAMEKICQYFERHEPSSPVPLLLRRAQRLVAKTFLEVIQDVCPDAISQIRLIGGVDDSSSDGAA